RVAKSGTSERIEYRIAALDRWFEVYAYPGRGDRVVTLYEDVTERKRIEIALRESEDQLRLIVENARDYAIFTMDLAGFVTDWREGAEAVFGFAHDEIVGRDARILFTPEDNAAGEPDRELALAARTGKAPNVRWHVCKDGRRVFIEGVCTALFDGAGRPTGFLKIGRDATERRAGEERQRVLLGELQHRVRNILSVVRSVFSRTLQGEGSLEDMAEHFQGRLDALARTQVVVTQNPHGTADLENLVREELLSVAARDGLQLSLDGPEVELSGEAAEALGLAVHELTTNSLKYGALRFPGARLTIRWSLDNVDYSGPARLVFMWEEQGVPAMPVNPVREGFGTELITRALPYRLGAKTGFELRPGGIRCTIDLPLPKATVPSGAS
ncbi:MAG TPA: PAS domain S-box protein, partial [Croceibacterium sp.]